MSPADRRSWLFPVFAAVLILFFLIQCFVGSKVKSPMWDETGDIAAGVSYLATDKFTVNLQHPPLLKELIGLSTLMSGAGWPNTPAAQQLLAGNSGLQWTVGDQIIINGGAEKVMFWARLPMILVAAMLAALLFFWGRRLFGGVAALGAVFLYCFDPTVVAHSYLTTLDVGFAAFTVLFFFTLWHYLRYPTVKKMIWCGLAIGAMLATKFSALVLLPVAAVLVLYAMWRPPATAGSAPRNFANLYSSSVSATAKVGPNDPCPCGSGKKYKKCHGEDKPAAAAAAAPSPKYTTGLMVLIIMGAIAVVVVEALYFFPSDPTLYVKGMSLVNADHSAGYDAYMAGHFSKHYLSYFVVAWLLKEPIATLILTIAGLALVLRSKTIESLDKLFLLLPPAAIVVAHSFLADNLGFRYVIPALPFAYLLGGAALAELVAGPAVWKRAAAGVLCAWLLAAEVGIHPDQLSYFNESACLLDQPSKMGLDGGSKCGISWLDDCNVDWGGGLKQLRDWWKKNAPERALRLAYFGSFPPQYYGLRFEPIGMSELLVQTPPAGLYAVSAHMVARAAHSGQNGEGQWLLRTSPMAVIGHSFYIYDVQ